MTKTKKIWAVILSVAMIVTVFAISASAATVYDKAVKLSPMELISHDFKSDTETLYKLVLSDSGSIRFYCSDFSYVNLILTDSNGSVIINKFSMGNSINVNWEISKKGTYYLKLERDNTYSSVRKYFNNFYYGFTPDNTPTMTIGVNMKVGDTLDLSAFASNYSGSVRWGTTKSKVATVNKGKVTAVAAGKAKIRAYMDNGEYTEIYVKVTKK